MSDFGEPWGDARTHEERCISVMWGQLPHIVDSSGMPLAAVDGDGRLERIVACVNACRCIPTEVLGPVLDRLFTAMMEMEGLKSVGDVMWAEESARCAGEDLVRAADLLRGVGVDLTELLKQCRLEKPSD